MVPPAQTATVLWDKAEDFAAAALQSPEGWLMTPRRTGTDGFFVSVLKRIVAEVLKLRSQIRTASHERPDTSESIRWGACMKRHHWIGALCAAAVLVGIVCGSALADETVSIGGITRRIDQAEGAACAA